MPVAKEIISPDAAGQTHNLDWVRTSSRRRGYTRRINKVETERGEMASEQEEIFTNLTATHSDHVVKMVELLLFLKVI